MYTGCPGRNVADFGRMFFKLKYTDITSAKENFKKTRKLNKQTAIKQSRVQLTGRLGLT
jgi:hypothetical protein